MAFVISPAHSLSRARCSIDDVFEGVWPIRFVLPTCGAIHLNKFSTVHGPLFSVTIKFVLQYRYLYVCPAKTKMIRNITRGACHRV